MAKWARLDRSTRPEKYRAYGKRRRAIHAEQYRSASRIKLYGVTPEQYNALLAEQMDCCAICRDPLTGGHQTHIDHDHGADVVRVRGLLCTRCNVGLGQFKDSRDRLAAAIDYLDQHT